MNYEKDLTSMGYRPLNKDTWGKPIGFQILTYTLSKFEFINFFKGNTDEILIWNSEIYDKDDLDPTNDFLGWLKAVEHETDTNRSTGWDAKFEFLTAEQYYEFLMG